jgi:TonB family protein
VPAGARFVCSYCGSKLVEHDAQKRRIGMRTGMLVGGGMGTAGLAMFAIGYFLGNPPAPADHVAEPHAKTAPMAAPVRSASATQPAQVAAPQIAADARQPAATVSPAVPPAVASTISIVAQPPAAPQPIVAPVTATLAADKNAPPPLPQPVPGPMFHSPPAASSPAPVVAVVRPTVTVQPRAAKLQTSRAAMTPVAPRLVFAMAERPVAKAKPPAPQVPVSPAPRAQVSTDTANAAAIASAHLSALLATPQAVAPTSPSSPPSQAPAAAPAPSSPEADRLNQAEAAKMAAPPPAPQKVAIIEPPAPAAVGPTRGFAPRAIQGGVPSYPAAYEGGDRTGHVTVKCRIEANGSPTGCQVVASHGGKAFDQSVLHWLGGGVRFAPILHNGQPTAETHQWNVDFQPAGG